MNLDRNTKMLNRVDHNAFTTPLEACIQSGVYPKNWTVRCVELSGVFGFVLV